MKLDTFSAAPEWCSTSPERFHRQAALDIASGKMASHRGGSDCRQGERPWAERKTY
jgi:hypothetical protein